jgi:Fe-Mn family superoxide dismutase
LDLWEHAYFTQYEGDKEAYVNRFWEFLDWEKVSNDFEGFL